MELRKPLSKRSLVKIIARQLHITDFVILPPDFLNIAKQVQIKLFSEGKSVVISGNNHSVVLEHTPFPLVFDNLNQIIQFGNFESILDKTSSLC